MLKLDVAYKIPVSRTATKVLEITCASAVVSASPSAENIYKGNKLLLKAMGAASYSQTTGSEKFLDVNYSSSLARTYGSIPIPECVCDNSINEILRQQPDRLYSERHESGLLEMLSPQQRRKLSQFICSSKYRQKLTSLFAHNLNLRSNGWMKIGSSEQHTEVILKKLIEMTQTSVCYCVSENAAIDGRFLLLHDALAKAVGWGYGTILSIFPGQVAYYEAEDTGERYIFAGTSQD